MNLRKFAQLFLSTVLIGLALGGLFALTGWFGDLSLTAALLTGGAMAAASLTGFWFYLTLNFMMSNITSFNMWVGLQTLLTAGAFYYLADFHQADTASTWLEASLYAAWPLGIALLGAAVKAQMSGWKTFLPSLFFLYAFTVIDFYMTSNSGLKMTQILIILLACNSYILLMYTRLLRQPSMTRKQEREANSH